MPGSARGAAAVYCLAALSLVSCRAPESTEPAHVVVVDSAGQYHVSLTNLHGIAEPRAGLVGVYRTDTQPAPVELFRVTGARFLDDGSLAVGNNGSQEILVLDPEGRLNTRIGRSGEGPGEFREINRIDVDGSGALWVYDARLRRLTTFGTDGVVSGSRQLGSPNPMTRLLPLSVLDDHRVIALDWESSDFTVLGARRDTTPLFVLDASGSVVDTLGEWPAQEWHYVALSENGQFRGTTRNEVGFGLTLAHSGRSGYVALGSTDSLDVVVYGRHSQPVMSVQGSGGGERVGSTELERWHADLADDASRASRTFLRTAILETPHRETYPAFGSLHLDSRHRLWIGVYPRPGQAEQRFIVLAADGTLWGVVDVPRTGEVLDIFDDRIAILRSTEVDEEFIEVFAITPALTPPLAGHAQ
jgi:hypothetical protein